MLISEVGGIDGAVGRLHTDTPSLARAMEAMRSPWLGAQNALRSVTGFAELQGIGRALQRSLPAFDERPSDALRAGLGDWREPIDWPSSTFDDPLARSAFYIERGFNSALTDFPAPAFAEGLAIAGLAETPPVDGYGHPEGDDEDEEGFARANAAHDRLLRFETRVRRFIEERMLAACGAQWVKQRVPGSLRGAWAEKKRKALDGGAPDLLLIAYADFLDYMQLITQRNNWEEVFKPVFRWQESVRESFQRLLPIRLATMHARIITQDDQLYLLAETTRILKAIADSGM